jgi:hypothetical protein
MLKMKSALVASVPYGRKLNYATKVKETLARIREKRAYYKERFGQTAEMSVKGEGTAYRSLGRR